VIKWGINGVILDYPALESVEERGALVSELFQGFPKVHEGVQLNHAVFVLSWA
jgi:hypothetical protein